MPNGTPSWIVRLYRAIVGHRPERERLHEAIKKAETDRRTMQRETT